MARKEKAVSLVTSPTKKSRRKYDEDFKREALKLVDGGRSAVDGAQTLDIAEHLLCTWRNQRK